MNDCSIVGRMHEEKPVGPLADGQLTITDSHVIYLMMWLTDSCLQIYSTKRQGTRLTQNGSLRSGDTCVLKVC